MACANVFVRHAERAQRGTWFNRIYGIWYELDGFVARLNANPWMIGHEREMSEIREDIERLTGEMNVKYEGINARKRLHVWRGGGELAKLIREWNKVKEQLCHERRRIRHLLRKVERESGGVGQLFEEYEVCNSGQIRDMYKILKVIGRNEWKAPPRVGITV